MGPQGPKGDTGETGTQGERGPQGPQGETGATGATPVISMTATVDQTTGTPSVSVSKSGSDEAPSFNLAITGIKGEKGDKGDTGDQGPQGDTGPQGPAGADAELPVGGTAGQVLTKTADGEAWEDVPAPDMTGVVKTDSDGKIIAGGSTSAISLKNGSLRDYAKLESSGVLDLYTGYGLAAVHVGESMGGYIKLDCPFDDSAVIETNGTLKIKGKSVREITDSISAPFTGNALTTDKAVADYVAANAGGGGGLKLLWEGTGKSVPLTGDYSSTVFFVFQNYLTRSGPALRCFVVPYGQIDPGGRGTLFGDDTSSVIVSLTGSDYVGFSSATYQIKSIYGIGGGRSS